MWLFMISSNIIKKNILQVNMQFASTQTQTSHKIFEKYIFKKKRNINSISEK